MGKVTPSMGAEVEALRGAYAALNRGDIPGMVRVFDPRIERIEPAGFPMAGTYRGLAAVTAHLEKGRGTWAEGSCEPERFVVVGGGAGDRAGDRAGDGAGDRVVVLIYVRVRLKGETEWREGRLADVFTFRDGKAVEFRTFGEGREGLEWAGVE